MYSFRIAFTTLHASEHTAQEASDALLNAANCGAEAAHNVARKKVSIWGGCSVEQIDGTYPLPNLPTPSPKPPVMPPTASPAPFPTPPTTSLIQLVYILLLAVLS